MKRRYNPWPEAVALVFLLATIIAVSLLVIRTMNP